MSCVRNYIKADMYCDILSCRASDNDDSPLWMEFFRTKMLEYMLEKGSSSLEIAEGDMIYDLIRETYLDFVNYLSSAVVSPKNISNLISSIQIDFPICECIDVLKDMRLLSD